MIIFPYFGIHYLDLPLPENIKKQIDNNIITIDNQLFTTDNRVVDSHFQKENLQASKAF